MRNMTAFKTSKEDIDFTASIRKCNCDSPISITLAPEMNVRDNCDDFSTRYASVESLATICNKEEQLGKSLISFTHPPGYRSLIMDIINDPPPDYAVVTGTLINVSSGILLS